MLLVFLLALLGAGLLYPIWLTVSEGFVAEDGGFTFFHVFDVLKDPATRTGLLNALGIATCTTLLCMAIAIPMSLVSVRCMYPGRRILEALILVPLILPPFVGAIGLHHLLGRHGAISSILVDLGITDHGIDFIGGGGFWAVVLIEALHLYPIIYLNAAAALANQDPALEEAAMGLGASRWQRLKHIVIPLMRPGLFAGSTIVFIWSLTELGTPLMFDYQQVTPVQIFNGIKEMNVSREPYALTVVLLLLAAGIYLLGKVFLGSADTASPSKASVRFTPKPLKRWGALGAVAFLGGISFIAMLPHFSVILASVSAPGGWYDTIIPTTFHGRELQRRPHPPARCGLGAQQPVLRLHRNGRGHRARARHRIPDRARAHSRSRAARCAVHAAARRTRSGDGLRLRGHDVSLALWRR